MDVPRSVELSSATEQQRPVESLPTIQPQEHLDLVCTINPRWQARLGVGDMGHKSAWVEQKKPKKGRKVTAAIPPPKKVKTNKKTRNIEVAPMTKTRATKAVQTRSEQVRGIRSQPLQDENYSNNASQGSGWRASAKKRWKKTIRAILGSRKDTSEGPEGQWHQ